MTRAEKIAYLERHGWVRRPRKHGARLEWVRGGATEPLGTDAAFDSSQAHEREVTS